MPAIIKSNSSLAAGNISLVDQSFSVSGSNDLVLKAKYLCLASYAQQWSAQLVIGVPPPVAAPSAISSYNLQRPLALSDVSVNIASGLAHFDCTFSAPRIVTGADIADDLEIGETSSVELRQFQGSALQVYTYKGKTYSFGTKVSYNFDYYAETKTLSASHNDIYDIGETVLVTGNLYISDPFNLILPQSWKGFRWQTTHNKFVEYRREKSKSSTGSYRYSITASIRYRYNGEFNSSPMIA